MSEKVELIFEDPPVSARRGRPAKYAGWLAGLRQHPNMWAKWPEPLPVRTAQSNVTRIKRGVFVGSAPGEFEAASHTIDGKGYLYVRYVGGSK